MRARTHWLHQRLTAIGAFILVPLMWYFILHTTRQPYEYAKLAVTHIGFKSLFCISVLCSLYHAYLGIEVIVQDYVKQQYHQLIKILIIGVFTIFGIALLFSLLTS